MYVYGKLDTKTLYTSTFPSRFCSPTNKITEQKTYDNGYKIQRAPFLVLGNKIVIQSREII